MYVFFFFQAEDGIRDSSVTGVQTCALPICPESGKTFTEAREGVEWRSAPARSNPIAAFARRKGLYPACPEIRGEPESKCRHSRRAPNRKTQEETDAEWTCPPACASRSYSCPELSGSSTHSV